MRCPQCHRRLPGTGACPRHPDLRIDPEPPRDEDGGAPALIGFSDLRLLGAGGFARVFAARRTEDGRAVAVKLARALDARFAQEADALRRIGAPWVPALLDTGVADDGLPYLVLELLEGQTLAALLAGRPGTGAVPLDELPVLVRELCRTVGAVHRAGILHRDIKPENLWLRRTGEIALLDVGLARTLDRNAEHERQPTLTRTGQRLGTAHYMAPEQCLDARHLDARSDLYGLGVVVFELLTGRPPFVGEPAAVMQAHVARRPPRVSELAPDLPAALDEVLVRCLSKAPEQRFASAAELLDALDRALRGPAAEPAAAATLRSTQPGFHHGCGLIAVRSDQPVTELLSAVESDRGHLARIHGGWCILAFVDPPLPAALRATLRAARRLREWLPFDDAVLVHAVELYGRWGALGLSVTGDALERPGPWLRGAPGTLLVTRDAAALVTTERFRPGPDDALELIGDALDGEATRSGAVALRGQDDLLDQLVVAAQRALTRGPPGLATMLGEVGLGKSRVLQALGERLEQIDRDIVLVRLRGRPPDASAPEVLPRTLLATLAGDPTGTAGVAAPGAVRPTLAREIAHALARRAERAPVVVLVDDAHRCDPTVLDALELATARDSSARLFVCATATPRLCELRPAWGDRAGAHARVELAPLDSAAARAVMLELLRPVEFVPEALVGRLVEMAGGVPLHLVEISHALRTSGAIRRHGEGGAFYIAPDELLEASGTPLVERIARRSLAALTPDLCALAQLCAALGDEVTLDELAAITRSPAAAADGFAAYRVLEPSVGLAWLARAGMLEAVGEHRYAFRHGRVREAIERLLPSDERRRIHGVLLAYLRGAGADGPTGLARRARHAAAAGAHDEAYAAHFELAEQARRGHRDVEADQHYSAALAQLAPGDRERRLHALAGRGRVRYRIQRFQDALGDLRVARALAEQAGAPTRIADLLLEEATVLDWLEDVAGAAALVDQARPIIAALGDARLSVRLEVAQGRHHVRVDQWPEAIEALAGAPERAHRAGEHEAHVVALMVLGFALTSIGRVDEAERAFAEAIAACEAAGDKLHLGVTHMNRALLWTRRCELERAVADLQRAVAIARETGNVQLERWSSFNLAEYWHWLGRDDAALPLAHRAHDLGVRFFEPSLTPYDALQLARIHCAAGRPDDARRQLDWIAAHCTEPSFAPGTQILLRLVEQVLAAGADPDRFSGWLSLVGDAQASCRGEERIEVLAFAVAAALHGGRTDLARTWLADARSEAEESPLSLARLDALTRALASAEAAL